jgi:membrane associated rhomboid family serine protease
MGIHDRDYYRESARSMFDSWGRWGVTTWLIVICSAIYFTQILTMDFGPPGQPRGQSPLVEYGVYNFERVNNGEVWRLLTSAFLHGGIFHLFFNMLVLYWAGSRLEERYGSTEFLLMYLAAALFAGLFRFGLQFTQLVPPFSSLGASGAISAVLVVYAFCYPHQRVMLWFFLPMPVWLLVVIFVAVDSAGMLGAGPRGIGNAAHLGGAFFGLLYYQSNIRLSNLIPSLPHRSGRRPVAKLRLVRSEPGELQGEPVSAGVEAAGRSIDAADEPFEIKVDRVLDKVSKLGPESLTAEERELLFRASDLYKKRRK